MAIMKIILQENYPSLGYVGDVVTVKKGYARNFLIPNKVGIEVSSRGAKMLKHLLSGIESKKARLKTEAGELAKQLESQKLEFQLKIGAGGKSFGSITSRDIHKALADKDFDLDRKQVRLLEPLKSSGEYKVSVQLHSEVVAEVPVSIEGIKTATKKGGARKEKVEAADSDNSEEVALEEEIAVLEEEVLEES